MKKIIFTLISLAFVLNSAEAKVKKRRLIIWSIDGFAAGYLTNSEFQKSKAWQRLLKRGRLFAPVVTSVPSLTYPAHTSMLTGKNTAEHRLYGNRPVDPFNDSRDGWSWFSEDIHKKPLWDIAREQHKSVANIMWPVTMTDIRRIRYHIPQFDRAKGEEEIKMMRVLATPGLYREIERGANVSLTEYSTDTDRLRAAKYIWHKKKPDLMLLYSPGLDSIEHADGPYTARALAHLNDLAGGIESFLKEIQKSAHKENTTLLIVSDHGFTTYRGMCYPNALLHEQGYIDARKKKWSYIFDTAGGVARLVEGAGAPAFDTKKFAEALLEKCPDIDVVDKTHEDFSYLRKEYDAGAALFLTARAQVLLSAAWNTKSVFNPKLTGHTHGFLPERVDMQTLALAFTPHKKDRVVKIRRTKDTFNFACHWLKLKCR